MQRPARSTGSRIRPCPTNSLRACPGNRHGPCTGTVYPTPAEEHPQMNPINSGDTGFVLMSAALVMFMTPGLAFFYGGLVRAKNVVHTMILSIVCMAVVGVLWALVGYSLSFSPGKIDWFLGGAHWFGRRGVGGEVDEGVAATIALVAFMLFVGLFAVLAPALVSGALV